MRYTIDIDVLVYLLYQTCKSYYNRRQKNVFYIIIDELSMTHRKRDELWMV